MNRYCVIYRTGGTENFKWRRAAPKQTRAEAITQKDGIKKMGYKAFVCDYDESINIGLPEGYEYVKA